jgi:hypothetical protein
MQKQRARRLHILNTTSSRSRRRRWKQMHIRLGLNAQLTFARVASTTPKPCCTYIARPVYSRSNSHRTTNNASSTVHTVPELVGSASRRIAPELDITRSHVLTDIRAPSGSHLGEGCIANLPIRAVTGASTNSIAHAEPAIKPKICSKARRIALGNHPRLCQRLLHKPMTLPSTLQRIAALITHALRWPASKPACNQGCQCIVAALNLAPLSIYAISGNHFLPRQTEQPAIYALQ